MAKQGIFCISLDFELYWGIRDKKTIGEYGGNILGAWEVVPRLLKLFKENDIHATWAIVGAMICEDWEEWQRFSPKIKPDYEENILSPYLNFYKEAHNENPKYFFGKELLSKIQKAKNQEVGTHTFSHYYCLEPGQTKDSFFADLQSCIDISKKNNFIPHSFVFPRHQLKPEYIAHFADFGIETYRGTETSWYNSPARGSEEGLLKRMIRFADYYLPMGAQHCQSPSEVKTGNLYRIRASRWLRPYSKKWAILDFLKVRRIKSQMTYAAKRNKIFHLWFHPHDIGSDIDKNFGYLEEIMSHYQMLNKKYHFQSLNFAEIKNYIDENSEV